MTALDHMLERLKKNPCTNGGIHTWPKEDVRVFRLSLRKWLR